MIQQFMLCVSVLMLALPALAQTNQELLRERLISPAVYNVLSKRGATTPEQRAQAIRDACLSGELGDEDCYNDRDGRRR